MDFYLFGRSFVGEVMEAFENKRVMKQA